MLNRQLATLMLSAVSVSAIGAAAACGGSDSDVSPEPAPVEAGPVEETGPPPVDAAKPPPTSAIVVTTRTSALAPALGTKANVTWAAYRDGAGVWKQLVPSSAGTYIFTTEGKKWGVALACNSADDLFANVSIYYRTTATTALDVPVADPCAPAGTPLAYRKLSGTLSNVADGSTRFAFGYGLGSLDTTLTVAGGNAPYTVLSVAEGKWDLAYGVRAASSMPLTRMLLRRGEVVGATDKTLDIDMNATSSFVPGSKNLTIRGLTAGETLVGQTFFAPQGASLGMSVASYPSPQLVPDNTFAYSTIAPAAAEASDTYRAEYRSSVPGGATDRIVALQFKTPVDVDVAFLPYVAGLASTVSATIPYVRLETKANSVANADSYVIAATASAAKTTRQSWTISYDAAALAPATALDDVMPDLYAVPGWKNVWALPTGTEASVSVTVTEKATPLSGGTSVRSTSATKKLTP